MSAGFCRWSFQVMCKALVLLCLVLAPAMPQAALAYPLTLVPETIEEALTYGERNRTPAGKLNDAPWVRRIEVRDSDIPGQVGVLVLEITWNTPFLELARARAIHGGPLTDLEIRQILQEAQLRAAVDVSATILRTQQSTQDEMEARTATIFVRRPDGAVVRPANIVRTGPHRITGVFQGYFTTLRVFLPYADGLDPSETVTVFVSWGARRLSAVFTLATIR